MTAAEFATGLTMVGIFTILVLYLLYNPNP
jgi:hypothetical protein